MMEEPDESMRKVFRAIHFDPIYTQNPKKHRKQIKYHDIPDLVKNVKQRSGKSWAESYETVRQAHIKYMAELFPQEGIKKSFTINDELFFSEQIPVGQFRSCYERTGEGLSAFRKHTFKKDEKVLIEYFHHSSPVPYEESDFAKRIDGTIKNLQQVADENKDKTLVEIRLLSPLKGWKSRVAKKYFTTLDDYDQLLETAIAAELCGREVILFNFGVNGGRTHADELQNLLNTRAMTKLFSKIQRVLGSKETALDKTLLIKELGTEKTTKKYFLAGLKEANKSQWDIWRLQLAEIHNKQKNATFTPEQQKIADLSNEIFMLTTNNKWAKPDDNYKIQAILVKLNFLLGHTVATGCNDAKDRDSRLAIAIEAQEIAEQTKVTIPTDIEQIEKIVYEKSTPREVAELFIPGLAHGLDIGGKSDGNDHLGNTRGTAGIFKQIYTPKQRAKYEKKDRWEKRLDKVQGWINNACAVSKLFYSLIFFFMSFAASAQDSVNIPLDSTSVSSSPPITRTVDPSSTKREETDAIEENKSKVKSWKEVRERSSSADQLTTVQKIERMGLNKNLAGRPQTSLIQEDREKMSRTLSDYSRRSTI